MGVRLLNGRPLDLEKKTYGTWPGQSRWESLTGVKPLKRTTNQRRGGFIYSCKHGALVKRMYARRCPMGQGSPCSAYIRDCDEHHLREYIFDFLGLAPPSKSGCSMLQPKIERHFKGESRKFPQRLGKEKDGNGNKSDGIGGHLAEKGTHGTARDGYSAAGSSPAQIESASSRDEQSKDSSHMSPAFDGAGWLAPSLFFERILEWYDDGGGGGGGGG
ncbi:hypothetical protein CPAR01_03346 [Colletotrichum paranaense]|uniref:Uncharacterized protein n=1 Tax=Colletotrichum paranaense TaxID=1914294 RepID=A0ABQ9T2Z8_9PEZI|nr:uncharacterized protein CPAR01_03346 [Colletotrichum paranaense]KAK1545844.1 hypothetical protein CPAR01_03346 [Colletotrichum paranaense]